MGMEFETFNGKGPSIETWCNTLNSTLTLGLDFVNHFDNVENQTNGNPACVTEAGAAACTPNNASSGTVVYQLNPPIPCYLKVFHICDCFLTMADHTGVMKTDI